MTTGARLFRLLIAAVSGPLCLSFLSADHAPASKEKPNSLFILSDDLGWGDIGAFDHPDWKTPNLDRLVGEPGVARRLADRVLAWGRELPSAHADGEK